MELNAEGKSEKIPIKLDFELYGSEKEMRLISNQLFNHQKICAKGILYIAFTVLILSLSIFTFVWINEEQNTQEQSIISTQIADELKNKELITPELIKNIESLIESTDHISEISIISSMKIRNEGINLTSYNAENMEPEFHYKRIVWSPKWLVPDFFSSGNRDSEWYIEMKNRTFSTFARSVLIVGLSIYLTLFTIWTTKNTYQHKSINIGWIFLFALFNVLGYLVYRYQFVIRKFYTDFLKEFSRSEEKSITIDVSLINNSHELHQVLKEKLSFPDTYSEGWDDFWDIITCQVELPKKLQFIGWSELERKLPDDSKIMIEYLLEHNQEFPDWHCHFICN
ncbi:barstar family protein [Bacillus sp. AFS088145]|uniref:barstar family protein n=1 Tax=Bacillus sp. AFS088145 TaxID=2033514 RepID=UPI002570888F|nr:barstar family protein [Bacillus sp. AFS088145]